MNSELRQWTEVDRVIHEPARLLIMTLLYALTQADFLYLLRETGLTKGNLSAHLARLEQHVYVEITKSYRGKIPQTICSLTPLGRSAFDTYQQQLKQMLDQLPQSAPQAAPQTAPAAAG